MSDRLYINNIEVDLNDTIAVPITYSIADFKNPEKRKRNSSKTVSLPGTQKNKQTFSSAYQLSLTDTGDALGFDINPNIRVSARYLKDGKEIFNGLCRLLEVKLMKGGYAFECVLFSDFVNIIKQMGDVLVGELDWSLYDHTLNLTNVANSWDTSVLQNGVVTSNYTAGKPDGFGYWYPWIDYGYSNSVSTFKINDLVPLLYIKETFEKTFESLGYTIDSDFIQEDLFKALTWGFGGGKKEMLPPLDVTQRRVEYGFDGLISRGTTGIVVIHGASTGGTNTYSLNGGGYYNLNLFTDTLVTDGYSQYNNTTGKITIQKAGTYKLNLDFDMQVRGIYSIPSITVNPSLVRVEVWKNGSKTSSTTNQLITQSYASFTRNQDFTLQVVSGDEIEVRTYVQTIGLIVTNTPFVYTVDVDYNSNFNVTLSSENTKYIEGDTMTMSRFIPKIKCSEFVKGIITMFNLYVSEPDENNVIKIEPILEYYEGEENWTQKLDYSKEVSIKSPDSAKIYNFKFTEDNDYYKKQYLDSTGEGYGNYAFDSNNEYNTKEIDFVVPFAQTCPVEKGSLVFPRIVNINDTTNVVTPYKGKTRIYFNNGLKTATVSIITASGVNTYTTYPQAHHAYEDITNPTFDLNFKRPESVYYSYSKYKNNNIFSKYQRLSIVEQTAIDSKILKAFFKLDSTDIYAEMFRKVVNINGVLYRKNVITDYDASGNSTTKVELYKVIETTEETIPDPPEIPTIPDRGTTPVILSPRGSGAGVPVISGGRNTTLRELPVSTLRTPTFFGTI
jgi:hypothetical protein